MTTSLFEYDCEAVRVRAKRIIPKGGEEDENAGEDHEEHRKFSVDPNLTSYDILKSILSRAFDISSDFVIYFLSSDEWLPLLSDWDLDVAILSASDPYLNLMITERKIKKPPLPSEVDVTEDPSMIVTSKKKSIPTESPTKGSSSKEDGHGKSSKSQQSQQQQPMLQSFKQHMEKSIMPSLASRFQRALNMAEDTLVPKGQQLLSMLEAPVDASGGADDQNAKQNPLSEKDLKTFLNKVGEVVKPRELRLAVYQRGSEPQLRKVLWKHLLGVYPPGLTGRQRVEYMKRKVNEYEDLKQVWVSMMLQGRVTDDLKFITNMVKKDVMRTDRHLSFYSGEGNGNVTLLYNILTTFALNHPSVGYCQGMSDLLSPLLVVMMDEGHAYVSFCALMSRLKPNFLPDGKTMTKKFEHLSQGLLYYDPEFYAYLKLKHANDLLYCYRWLLLEMKREFSFEDACTALEVLWASLPPESSSQGTELYEEKFFEKKADGSIHARGNSTLSGSSTFPKRETTLSNVVTLRKRLKSTDHGSPKKGNRLLKDYRGRIQSDGSADPTSSGCTKAIHKSQRSRSGSSNRNCSESTKKDKREGSQDSRKRVLTELGDFYKLSDSDLSREVQEKEKPNESESNPLGDVSSEENSENSDLVEPVDYAMSNKTFNLQLNRLPSPTVFGDGNPFLIFMCIACILQHRDYILEQQLDYQEIAMYFDRMVRRHNVRKTLSLARKMFAEYLNDDWKRDVGSKAKNFTNTLEA